MPEIGVTPIVTNSGKRVRMLFGIKRTAVSYSDILQARARFPIQTNQRFIAMARGIPPGERF